MMKDQQNTGFDPNFQNPNFQGPDEDGGLDIQEYYHVIKKHRSIVLVSLVLCVVMVSMWTLTNVV